MSDTYTPREKHHGAIGMHRMLSTVWAFDEACCHEPTIRMRRGSLVQTMSHASSSSNDKRHGGLTHGENVLTVHS